MSGLVEVSVTRRAVVRGVVVAGVGAVVGWAVARNSAAANGSSNPAAANGYGYAKPPGSSSGNGRRLVAESAVPAGGGVVVRSAKVVLTRDDGGGLHAFSAVCTHQGCLVSSVRSGTIDCPCHGSRFAAATGKVVAGPAPAPLPAVSVDVVGGVVYAR